MSEGRDRSEWMSLVGLHDHFKLHDRQTQLLDQGLKRINIEGPAFIVLHTGAALRGNGKASKDKFIGAILDRMAMHKEEADVALNNAAEWARILDQIKHMDADDDQWKNPLWEIELSKEFRKGIKSERGMLARPFRKSAQPFNNKFRRGLKYKDVVCIYKGQFSAFTIDRSDIGQLFTFKGQWNPLFPDVNFERQTFRWMVFPKDMSGNATTAYLQFATMAGPKAGNGKVQRFDFREGQWKEGEVVETWLS